MVNKGSILVIDDENTICSAFEQFFVPRGWTVEISATASEAVTKSRIKKPDVVFLDIRLPDGSGLEIMDSIAKVSPGSSIIIITAYGSLDTVIKAIDGKAFDHLFKPLDLDRAEQLAKRAMTGKHKRRNMPSTTRKVEPCPCLIGTSTAMQEIYKRIGLVARSESSVLILGETGTGKELAALAIHNYSNRREGPFVAVNCGSIPENLAESELFGHEKGAFTGAETTRKGRFEAADGGTLFLDEIGELSASAQVKLLRVLDSKTIERVGTVKPIKLDLRIIAATNRPLNADVSRGRFREDLYHRLNVIHIQLPPLKERTGDIEQLSLHFLACFGHNSGIEPETLKLLNNYSWPGNVRELQNAMEHAALVSSGTPVIPENLPLSIRTPGKQSGDFDNMLRNYIRYLPQGENRRYRTAVRNLEQALITEALEKTYGNRSRAADLLGMHRNTLRKKIRELKIAGIKGS